MSYSLRFLALLEMTALQSYLRNALLDISEHYSRPGLPAVVAEKLVHCNMGYQTISSPGG